MKRLIASAGLVAVGATGLQAAYAPGLTPMETSKTWSVAASLRGFYDDNYNTAPSHPSTTLIPGAKGSFGAEISPQFALNFPGDQTFVSASYVYILRYYEARANNNTDHTHQFDAKLDHRFSERYHVVLSDSFAYSQEPEVLESNGTVSTPVRTSADGLRNQVNLDLTGQITELFGFEAAYHNTWYNYFQNASDFAMEFPLSLGIGSHAALLNRIEHLFDIKGTWQVQEHLLAFAGYKYGIVNYTSSDPVDIALDPGSIRDNVSHYFYLGASRSFSPQLTGSIQAGAQYTHFEHIPNNSWTPYVDMSGAYSYLPGSSVQLGFRHQRNATDVLGNPGAITGDQETSTVYASINHRFTSQLTASLVGQYQMSQFNGGTFDGKVDNFLFANLTVAYRFNQNWAAEASYYFDKLDSGLPDEFGQDRSFKRDRYYVGVRANY
jgi:hypothetical protein